MDNANKWGMSGETPNSRWRISGSLTAIQPQKNNARRSLERISPFFCALHHPPISAGVRKFQPPSAHYRFPPFFGFGDGPILADCATCGVGPRNYLGICPQVVFSRAGGTTSGLEYSTGRPSRSLIYTTTGWLFPWKPASFPARGPNFPGSRLDAGGALPETRADGGITRAACEAFEQRFREIPIPLIY